MPVKVPFKQLKKGERLESLAHKMLKDGKPFMMFGTKGMCEIIPFKAKGCK